MYRGKLLIAAALLALTAAPATAEVVTAPATLRAGPGVKYAAIASLAPGTQLGAVNCRAGWCSTSWLGRKGYLPSTVVAASGPGAGQIGPFPRAGYGASRYPEYWTGRFGRNDYAPSHGIWASGSILD